MKITLNGEPTELAGPTTLAALLDERIDAPREGTAVAVDGAVVPRVEHPDRVLQEGAAVEVVTAVQGG
ncbi:sulfur carrier protein ThiS [Nocardioides perillae]|uniref:Sulfur carrier protein n=1 Tax=Nocardioides perillae TaxID=1119534 RepID=A0A7Y9UVE3_9ACTN|nr:sulfur carrier protein [Nocardioides perillae]